MNCPIDRYGSRQWHLVFDGHDCREPNECPEIDGTYRKTNNGWAYYLCMDGEPAQYSCPLGSRFDGRGCESESAPNIHGSFRCPHDGLFNNPFSKTSFVECIDGRPYVKKCRLFTDDQKQWSLMFNNETERCVQPFECPQIDNTFKRVNSGRVHYKCKDGGIEEFHCAKGTTFDGRACQPPRRDQVQQRPRHFRVLVQNRHMIKFEFENKVVTDTFDQVSWRWNRVVEYNDFI